MMRLSGASSWRTVMSARFLVPHVLVTLLVVACDSATAPTVSMHLLAPSSPTYAAITSSSPNQAGSCSFDRGTTTCVTTEQYTETSSHVEYSGCLAGPPPDFRTGSRARTFSDSWQVTITTTTLYRGRSDRSYDTSSSTSRLLLSSVLVSDVCEPI